MKVKKAVSGGGPCVPPLAGGGRTGGGGGGAVGAVGAEQGHVHDQDQRRLPWILGAACALPRAFAA